MQILNNKIFVHLLFQMRYINRLITKFLVIISILIVIFNEYFIYFINQTFWKEIYCKSSVNCTRILFVADPQLLGKEYDKSFYSSISRIDADRYVRNTFKRAVAFTKPDIICFLGDLLDEGNIASPQHFSNYVERFRHVFKTEHKAKYIHIPGDNDIGGENGEYISNSNIRRFEIEFMNEDIFDYDNQIRFFKINRMLLDFTNPDRDNNADRFRIGISHMPILIAGGSLLRNVLNELDPHVIFSAHWHESRIFLYPSAMSKQLYDNKIQTFDLTALKNDHTYLEIMVPTSSYRMGKQKIGFGYAILDNNILNYTVLWNPNRFIFLIVYISWIMFVLIIQIIIKIITRCPFRKLKRKQYNNLPSITNF